MAGATDRDVMRRGLCSAGDSFAAANAARCSLLLIRRSCLGSSVFVDSIPRHKPKTIGCVSNEVFEAARTILAVREFEERPVPDDVLGRILEAGRLTASARNGQPWHFVVVRERDGLRKLGSLVRTGPYTANAAAAIIVAYEKSTGQYGLSDASRAIQTMLLVAWGEGVGSNWTGFGGLENVREEFAIPEAYDVLAVVPLGYPRRKISGKKKRKPLSEVVSAERFGQPVG